MRSAERGANTAQNVSRHVTLGTLCIEGFTGRLVVLVLAGGVVGPVLSLAGVVVRVPGVAVGVVGVGAA